MTTKTGLESLGIDGETPARLVLISPFTNTPIKNTKGEEAYIMLLGNDSLVAVKHRRAATNKHLAKRAKLRGKITAEELEDTAAEMLAAQTKGWKLINFEGEDIDFPFTKANAVELYSNPSFSWIHEQVNEFVDERANFIKR